ncbi:MAG: TCR/Tet family MFS transporter [Rhodobacteraceae bacterium]|nr:TCR/Tet family MFS transporter [Paracoccaceae bacterium]
MQNSKATYFIMATLMLDAIGVGLVFPIMPDLMARVGADTTAEGAFLGGVLMAAYAAMQFLFGPAIGNLSDAVGRRPVLIVALGAMAIDYVVMALASAFWVLLIGRVVAGIAGATFITATAYLADISPPKKRAANFGLIGAAYGIGFVMGPAFGGMAAAWHLSAPFWLAAGFSGINVIFGLLVLPESLPLGRRRAMTLRGVNPFTAILDALRLPGLALPLLCLFIFEFANMVYPTLWAFWLRESFAWGATLIGLTLTAYGLGVAITQGGLLRVLIPRWGEYRTLMFAVGCSVVGLVGIGLARVEWLVFALLPVAALADMTPPTITAMMSVKVDEDRQGMLQGVIASMASISAVVAPLLMTSVFQIFARPNAPVYLPGAPFLMSGLMILAIWPFFMALSPRRKTG